MPLRSLCAEVLKIEQIAEKLSRALSDDHRVRLGYRSASALQGSASLRRCRVLLRLSRSDQIADYDQSGGNADAGLQWQYRTSSPPTAWINSSPARTARSASSSWACG